MQGIFNCCKIQNKVFTPEKVSLNILLYSSPFQHELQTFKYGLVFLAHHVGSYRDTQTARWTWMHL